MGELIIFHREHLAKFMHDEYERIAKEKGWKTQDSCQVAFKNLPKENKEVMLELAGSVIQYYKEWTK